MTERLGKFSKAVDWVVYDLTANKFRLREPQHLKFNLTKVWKLEEVSQFFANLGLKDEFLKLVQMHEAGDKAWRVIDYVDFIPFQPEFFKDFEGRFVLNGWIDPGFAPAEGPYPTIERLLNRLIGGDPDGYEWLTNFLAYRIQHPDRPAGQAVFFATKPGSGKDTFFYLLERIYGRPNSRLLPPERLDHRFNTDLAGKALVCANEVIDLNDTRERLQEILKSWITSKTLTLEAKHQNAIEVSNIATWLFFTNRPETISLQPDDRRFSVFVSKEENLKSGWVEWVAENFWDKLTDDLRPEIIAEIQGWFHALLHRDVSKWVPLPYDNAARRSFLEQGSNSIIRFMDEVKERGLKQTTKDYGHASESSIDDHTVDMNAGMVSKKMLFSYYKRFCKDEGITNSKLPRFNRQVKELLGDDKDHVVKFGEKSVRCFDMSRYLNPEVKE